MPVGGLVLQNITSLNECVPNAHTGIGVYELAEFWPCGDFKSLWGPHEENGFFKNHSFYFNAGEEKKTPKPKQVKQFPFGV